MAISTHVLWLAPAYLALFAGAEFLYHRFRVRAERTRQIVHAGSGLITLLFPLVLASTLEAGILCATFLVLLLVTRRLHLLPAIHAVSRRTSGSWLFPISVLMAFAYHRYSQSLPCTLFRPVYYFYLPVLLLAVCDPLAALAGTAWRKAHPATAPGKTMAGSMTFFIAAAILCILLAWMLPEKGLPANAQVATGLATAFAATFAERLSGGGWDNLTIPGTTLLCLHFTDRLLCTI